MNDLTDIWSYLGKIRKPVVLYGMGNGADIILNELERLNIKVSGVFASDDFVRGQTFRGFTVKKYSDFVNEYGDFIVLTAFGSSRPEVLDNIRRISSERELYSVDVPVYGKSIFNYDFAYANGEKIEKVLGMLADERSRSVYMDIVRFKYTGRIDCLFSAESTVDEDYELLRLNGSEIYFDAGAYTGDTVEEFLRHAGSCRKIYAAEPDEKTFAKLERNTAELENTELHNICISDKKGTVDFSMAAGRNSSKGKGKTVSCDSIDSILDGREVTFIKADVEGMEEEMLSGLKQTLLAYKPKMKIACYHRTEDIFDIPLRVNEIRNDYKLHIRHNPYIPAWDTNFFFL